MAKLAPAAITSIVVILLGVLFFVGAVSGSLFGGATPLWDVGMWSVVIVLFVLGGLGLWVSLIDRKAPEP